MNEFKDKVVLITGGSGGIGEKIAEEFLKQEALVYISGRNLEKLSAIKQTLSSLGGQIEIIQADVSRPEECEAMVETILEKEDKLDILVNSAGVYEEQAIEEVTEAIWDKSFNTNVKGTYFLSKFAIPYLEKTEGCIVNVSSTAGIIGFDENSLYCATKGAVNMLTKALARECAPRGIRVNAVCPDMVKTDMLDIGFKRSGMKSREEYNKMRLSIYPQSPDKASFVLPEEVAASVVFLASTDHIRAINGVTLLLDNGIAAAR